MTCCLKGGHVTDAKNSISATRDGKIAAVAEHIDAVAALKVVDANGLYVTPGLIDVHVHVYTGTGERNSYAGIRTQATTACIRTASLSRGCDHGGQRRLRELEKFEEFKQRIIDRSKTRVPAFLNAQKRHTILGRNGPRWNRRCRQARRPGPTGRERRSPPKPARRWRLPECAECGWQRRFAPARVWLGSG
jgi:predicted amidohydrolase